jgi:PAS domain S-box-containing protein
MTDPRVLVVDDDEGFCNLMASHLDRRGFEVEQAQDGLAALKRLQETDHFDVLVTDLTMPKMSGQELLREARQLYPELEVVVITAAGDVNTAISCMREDGAFDYLIKPLDTISELSLSIRRALEHRNLRREREELNARLAQEARTLQAILANTGDAILFVNSEGRVSVVNQAAEDLLGGEELVGKDALTSLPPQLSTLVANWQAIDEGETSLVEINWPGDSYQLISLTSMEAIPNQGEAWMMVIRDITHLKRLEDLKLRMLTETASKIRLPLALATSTLAELGDTSVDPEDQTATIFRLATLLNQIQVWMDDLVSLVRIESGMGLQPVELNFASFMDQEAQSDLQALALERGASLTVEVEPGLPLFQTDEDLLKRLLHGMVAHAALGGSPEDQARLRIYHEGEQLWIEVSGPGFSSDRVNLGQVLEDSTVEGEHEGTGFELIMIKTISEHLGGHVWNRSQDQEHGVIAINFG